MGVQEELDSSVTGPRLRIVVKNTYPEDVFCLFNFVTAGSNNYKTARTTSGDSVCVKWLGYANEVQGVGLTPNHIVTNSENINLHMI